MIRIDGLCKKLGGKTVLDSLSSHVKKGSIYGLIGSNGAGKSTLLNIISGVYRADAGEVLVDGESVYENITVKNKIAYVSDDPFYFNASSMKEMAEFLNAAYPSFSMEKFYEIAKSFPLDIKARLGTFSKGMKRQAAIVLALSQSPDLLLCDECFDGLDPVIKQLVKRILINEVAERDMTVIISSHSLRELENLCDVVGILHNNTIITEKSMDEIKERLHKIQLAIRPMISEDELPEGLETVKCEIRGNMMELVVRGELSVIEEKLNILNPLVMDCIPLSLEDVFIYEMEASGYDFSKMLI